MFICRVQNNDCKETFRNNVQTLGGYLVFQIKEEEYVKKLIKIANGTSCLPVISEISNDMKDLKNDDFLIQGCKDSTSLFSYGKHANLGEISGFSMQPIFYKMMITIC